MLVSEPGLRRLFLQNIAEIRKIFLLTVMGSLCFGFIAVAASLTQLRAQHFETPVALSAGFELVESADLRRCWVPSDRSEPRECWMVPGEPAKEQRLRIDGDGSLEDCWPHPDEADVDICESPQMAFVV